MKGRIITIEGLDGAGKSTQIDLLVNAIEAKGIKYKFIHFPMLNQGVYGTLIAEFLRGEFGSLEVVHPKLVALLFAEDRNEHKQLLNEWLDEGYLIIMDRFVKSNIAFQCAKVDNEKEKEELKDWILDFEFNHNQLPKPVMSFFLDLPMEFIEKSLSNTRVGEDRDYLDGKTDIHEADIDFQRNVYKEYQKLLSSQQDFHRIECSENGVWLPAEDIHKKIIAKIGI